MYLQKTLLIFTVLSTLLSACESQHERANAYVAKAQGFFNTEEYILSRIEAMNAIQIESGNADARYLLARIAEHNRNLLQSVYHLRIAVENDPSHVAARLNLGNLYLLAQFTDPAAKQLAALIVLSPENAEVRTLSANILYRNEEFDEAEKEIDYALKLNPQLISALIFKAGLQMKKVSLNSALLYLEESIKIIDPEKALPLRQFRIMLLRGADRIDEVEVELNALIRDFPDREHFVVSLARLYASQDMIDRTEIIIQSLINKYPNNMNRRISYVQFIAENRGINKAIDELNKIITEYPNELILQLLLGRLYEATGSADQALATYRQIASTAPASKQGLASRNRIAVYLIDSGQTEKAIQLINEIRADETNNNEALLINANLNYTYGNYESAIGDLRIVLRSDQESEFALLLLARSHLRVGNLELASDSFWQLIKVNPRHPTAATEFADLLIKRGNALYAADILRGRQKIDPQNLEVTSALIEVLIDLNELDTAEALARQMIEIKEPSGLAEFQLGQVLQAKGSDPEAIAAYTLALVKDPEAEPPLLGILETFIENKKFEEAIDYLENRLSKYPTQVVLKFMIGTVYMRQGDFRTAEKRFEGVIAEYPNNIRTFLSLVELFPDNPDERIKIYRRSLDANPDNLALNMLLAIEYQQYSYYEDAISLYENILKTDPGNYLVANNLAVLLLDQRSDADSFSKALQLALRFSNSSHPAVIDTLGWAYYRTGDMENAIQYLKIAVDMADEAASLHYHLGMAYYSTQNVEPARQELQKSIALAQVSYPGIDKARETLDSIFNNTTIH